MSKVVLIEEGNGYKSATEHSTVPAAEKYRDDLTDVFPIPRGSNIRFSIIELEEPLTDEELAIISVQPSRE